VGGACDTADSSFFPQEKTNKMFNAIIACGDFPKRYFFIEANIGLDSISKQILSNK